VSYADEIAARLRRWARHLWEPAGVIHGTGELVVRCRLCAVVVVESDALARQDHERWHEERGE
jgi:hypothetical protein